MQNSTNGFGLVNVNGRSLVPKPPTNIKPFIVNEKNGRKNLNDFQTCLTVIMEEIPGIPIIILIYRTMFSSLCFFI